MNSQKPTSVLCSLLLFGFLLGSHQGQLALWKDQDPVPYKVFPCPISALPENARQALENGIPIDSLEDLQALLEKYLP